MKSNLEIQSNLLRLYQIANANLEFHPSELAFLYNYAIERGVDEFELKRVLHSPPNYLVIPNNTETKIEFLYDLIKMSLADGDIDEDEKMLLKKFAITFGFDSADINGLLMELEIYAKENKSISELLKLN